jgi:hypothetical protein
MSVLGYVQRRGLHIGYIKDVWDIFAYSDLLVEPKAAYADTLDINVRAKYAQNMPMSHADSVGLLRYMYIRIVNIVLWAYSFDYLSPLAH